MSGLFLDQVRRLAADALASNGERTSLTSVEWDVAGDCMEPVPVELFARRSPEHRIRAMKWDTVAVPTYRIEDTLDPCPESSGIDLRREGYRVPGQPKYVGVGPGMAGLFRIGLFVRCRKCTNCLRLRRNVWAARARAECRMAARTWFGTITLSPERHYLAVSIARDRCTKAAVDFDELSYKEQFIKEHNVISRWLTLYLKRVRKESGARLRYLLVAEAHKSGLPHYHMLIHEPDDLSCVRYDTLKRQWPNGFTAWKLLSDPRKATYLCKYLSKSGAARVRASIGYGYGLSP